MQIRPEIHTHNIAEYVRHPDGDELVTSRIPDALRLQLNPNAQRRALETSGCEIRFRMTEPTVRIRVKAFQVAAAQHGGGLAQVLFGDFSHTYFPVSEKAHSLEITAPDYRELEQATGQSYIFHPRLVRLLLPTHAAIDELSVEGGIAPPEEGDVPARRMLIYGSSITQGSAALSSRESWAGRCAHLLRADLVNLGFGGGCHCEPVIADYLCARDDFDILVLETGINMLGMNRDWVRDRIRSLIQKVSTAHPGKPVFCLGVFPCRDDVVRSSGGHAEAIRSTVKATVKEIRSPNLHYIDGKQAYELALGVTRDLVHPGPQGMLEIGNYVGAAIKRILARRAGGQ